MSDSDSTWPATDDFGSRFLEVDEYIVEPVSSTVSPKNFGPSTNTSSTKDRPVRSLSGSGKTVRTRQRQFLRSYADLEESLDLDLKSNTTSLAKQRLRRQPKGYWDTTDAHEEGAVSAMFSSPKLYTARQMSLHMKRTGAIRVSSPPTSPTSQRLGFAENLKSGKAALTPEQLASRQHNIARRRESAKNKAELQKQQTVERLLKINSSSDGFRRRGRGRGARFIRNLLHSTSASSLLSTSSRGTTESSAVTPTIVCPPETLADIAAPILPRVIFCGDSSFKADINSVLQPDPPTAYIRFISSQRLSPSNRICFSRDNNNLPIIGTAAMLDAPNQQLCSQGCGRPRKYACSTTGLPLCSLSCYKSCTMKHQLDSSVRTATVG